MSNTMTETVTRTPPAVMTTEVPLVAGDVLRATDTPAVSPPTASPPPPSNGSRRTGSPTGSVKSTKSSKGHRRTSSAASDIAKAAGIDLDAVSMAEARKVMSEEHKVLGFRPPHGSFAAEVQSIAAKHPEGKPGASPPDTNKLKEIAREDALRILAERKTNTGADKDALPPNVKPVNGNDKHVTPARHSPPAPGVNLNKISATAARVLMSHEHRALGFRPPPGSLAAEAQSAAARHPDGDGTHLDDETLREIALRDAERIKADRELNIVEGVNVSTIGKDGAAVIQSEETRALGHPPPSGSLASEAQSAAERHPGGGSFKPDGNPAQLEELKEAARHDAERLRAQEESAKVQEAKELERRPPSPPKVDKAVETEPLTEAPPEVVRTLTTTPPLSRTETGDSVEIVGDVVGSTLLA
ncbi:hypothetical protein PYCCODRAFT_1408813 [Trametes coccinea BRFM310]|uniref:SMP domain-containing protein n=1 Tax=Trametes coccinea (strain BRFM310) TaxID=1353009 RepID=A0A1Y2IRL6_TRAC3|nr:hypothetical protein PYCCODRAFT_1408813 [Trametes coccinea BRFM310]